MAPTGRCTRWARGACGHVVWGWGWGPRGRELTPVHGLVGLNSHALCGGVSVGRWGEGECVLCVYIAHYLCFH